MATTFPSRLSNLREKKLSVHEDGNDYLIS